MSGGAASGDGLWGRLRGLTVPGGDRSSGRAVPSFAMTDLLERGRAAKPPVSALDAVMGKDWAIVEAGRAGRAPVVRAGIAVAHRRDVARHSGGGSPGGRPQAVVKMIRQGGASDLRGMRAQMAYLSRQGEEPLQRSERYMGVEIDAEQADLMERAWRMPSESREGGADRTTHFIVSFPEGTDTRASERAGRAWAEALFGSGDHGGDSFDYYTAFHTDRAHPHMHVVVHRRGLEHGAWLKVSLRSDLTYDRMREVLVDVAAREGIELEATPRLTRGVHDRVVPDAEYRRASAARRDPVAPGHTPETALRAAAGLIHYAREAETEARLLNPIDPAQAERFRAASLDLGEGRALTPTLWGLPEPAPRTGEPAGLQALAERHLEAFERRDVDALDRIDPVERVHAMREIAALKAEARPALGRYGADLDPFTRPDDSGRYDGLAGAEVTAGRAHMANRRIAGIAARYGVDAAATVERVLGGMPSQGLARDFQLAEVLERDANRAEAGEPVETPEEAMAATDRMHEEIGAVHSLVRAGRSPYADVADRMAAERPTDREQDRFDEVTEEVCAKFARLDTDAQNIEDHATRMKVLRQIADLKAGTADQMRDPGDLGPFIEPDDSGRYVALPDDDAFSVEVRSVVVEVVQDIARDYGVDPDAMVERLSGPAPSRGLARQFALSEAREREETRIQAGLELESVAARAAALTAMQDELGRIHNEGCAILAERRAEAAKGAQDRSAGPRDVRDAPRDVADWHEDDEREDRLEIAASGPWRSLGAGRGAVRDLALRGGRGFHPAYAHAPNGDPDATKTRASILAVATPEEALDLAKTFSDEGDRRVREIVTDRKRAGRDGPDMSWKDRMTPDEKRILRDLERDSGRDDYDPF